MVPLICNNTNQVQGKSTLSVGVLRVGFHLTVAWDITLIFQNEMPGIRTSFKGFNPIFSFVQ